MSSADYIDEWIHTAGVGKIEWTRQWSASTAVSSSKYEWTLTVKLTSRIGGMYVVHTRVGLEDARLKQYSSQLLEEITAAYVEFQLEQNAQKP